MEYSLYLESDDMVLFLYYFLLCDQGQVISLRVRFAIRKIGFTYAIELLWNAKSNKNAF